MKQTEKQLMDYKIIQSDNPESLQLDVNNLIKDGYIPQGGICVSEKDGYCWQAMIKCEEL